MRERSVPDNIVHFHRSVDYIAQYLEEIGTHIFSADSIILIRKWRIRYRWEYSSIESIFDFRCKHSVGRIKFCVPQWGTPTTLLNWLAFCVRKFKVDLSHKSISVSDKATLQEDESEYDHFWRTLHSYHKDLSDIIILLSHYIKLNGINMRHHVA